MRKLVKFGKSENCITVQTLCKDNAQHRYRNRSSSFYFLKEELKLVIAGVKQCIYSKDGYSWAEVCKRERVVEFQIYWLHSNGYSINGDIEYITVDYKKLFDWFYSDGESMKVLHIDSTRKTPKFVFKESKMLKKVLENDMVRKKFVKHITHFMNYDADEILFYDDFCDYSFGWTEMRNGKRIMNGGLIFHKDYDAPENLSKGKYGVHT